MSNLTLRSSGIQQLSEFWTSPCFILHLPKPGSALGDILHFLPFGFSVGLSSIPNEHLECPSGFVSVPLSVEDFSTAVKTCESLQEFLCSHGPANSILLAASLHGEAPGCIREFHYICCFSVWLFQNASLLPFGKGLGHVYGAVSNLFKFPAFLKRAFLATAMTPLQPSAADDLQEK